MIKKTHSYQTAEYGKFITMADNSAFPPVSVIRLSYPDNSNAFPSNSAVKPLSSVDMYSRYAVLSYGVNSVYRLCESKTSGNPSFTSEQILIYNPNNSYVFVILTLTSGMSCRIPMGKQSESNHFVTLNLAVSAVNDYADCEITFFA
jgi:hypothetical protein